VGAMALRTCIRGAFLNVKINAAGLDDKVFAKEITEKGSALEAKAMIEEDAILKIVDAAILKQNKA
jgi:glutamate formiminotransferase/formiminotetrahydrofolate cyclodeaminase